MHRYDQETFRRGSSNKHYDAADSILSERAAREIYLKPFEMLVREAFATWVKRKETSHGATKGAVFK
ncbi:MAG: hypothetical protein HDR28_10420 [Lachnospiraceae bacterium]|nr:hypothetical protein [Lachnospiraceae bacterium]